jgi:hypothetical protein
MRGRALDGSVSRGGERENFGLNDPSGYMWFMHQAANLFGHVGPKAGSPTAVTDLRRNAFDDKQLVFDRVYPVHLPGVESIRAADLTNHGLASFPPRSIIPRCLLRERFPIEEMVLYHTGIIAEQQKPGYRKTPTKRRMCSCQFSLEELDRE